MARRFWLVSSLVFCLCCTAQVDPGNYLENEEEPGFLAGVLNASRDLFSRTVSFDFSPAFFKRRSLEPDQRSVLLNGVVMNKFDDGRANWSNWGGLNDALRNQDIVQGLEASDFCMGKLGESLNMNSFAKLYSKGLKVSVAASNRSYASRFMATYGSRWLEGDWKFNISISARLSREGYREGTPFRGYSCLLSVDKRIDEHHYLNGTIILAHAMRGMASAMTREVFEIKGNRYNSYWGFHAGAKRSARLKTSFEPLLQLNYAWSKNAKTSLRAHATYQFGSSGRSRLDYGGSRLLEGGRMTIGGGVNPDPTYYQKLPSYFMRDEDEPNYAGAFLAAQSLSREGQIDWRELYEANLGRGVSGNSVYVLYEDRIDDARLMLQMDIRSRLSKRIELSGSLSGSFLRSERYALLTDLLGGSGFLDIDPYDEGLSESQSDLRRPNRIVGENEPFKYNYLMQSEDLRSFLRMDYRWGKQEIFLAGGFDLRKYRRTGRFENGSYPGDASYGKGNPLQFPTVKLKFGITHKFSGRHLLQCFAAILQEPPAIRDSYSNIRENHEPVLGVGVNTSAGIEMNYQMRLPRMRARLGCYLTEITGGSRVSFYYADGLTGLDDLGTSAFVHEVMTGIGQLHMGTELSLDYALTNGLRLKGVASFGLARYVRNPLLYITSDELKGPVFYGPSFLKGYRVPNGPQNAFSLGFEYSDPNYWWVGLSSNWFNGSFVHVAPMLRTKNFIVDSDGLMNSSYDEAVARELLKQEELPAFSLVNLVGGKSWKLKGFYLGFFASINNALNATYKTGGYEQSRNANYETLLGDRSRRFPLFSPKYWYGYGATFFASVYLRTD